MMAPPPTADAYCLMINCPETESVAVPCEYATIPGTLMSVGVLDQAAQGRFGLQYGSIVPDTVASCGLMESISKVPGPSMESRRAIRTSSCAALRVSVSTSSNPSLPFSLG